ncbi:DDE Tnp4 domain-containing protein [Mycena indigotica]|uniref:DDE Tnp4 domain-containing protein n=1 Tax=Mycena indigotica TaxID=2126181 RepID=A0A8H6RYE4_9AGAR|nr:DDE Tnp4 domain-containing protein [Mycena indigotica]KAF7289251.1 DDE Tnp4 domain-containing protein [Mycena indigotica]
MVFLHELLRKLTLLSCGILPRQQPRPSYIDTLAHDSAEDWGSDYDSDSDASSASSKSDSESDSESDIDDLPAPQRARPRIPHPEPFSVMGWASKQIDAMYARRYENERHKIVRSDDPTMRVALDTWRYDDPDSFRTDLRVWPKTFNRLVQKLENNAVFHNGGPNKQKPVEEQLAIALYQFGHHSNAASLTSVANWAGYGKGTISKCTTRVIKAILAEDLLRRYVRMPTEVEKEEAKRWVARKAGCEGWRDGWCMVDGTLVPFYARPHYFGESYFDRKQNYSLNVQVVNLPNLRIVDIGFGHVGSTHDTTAFGTTKIYQQRQFILKPGEWIWGDAAYPICDWVVCPFKKPERDEPDNTLFNNHVSFVRVRSEHCIGFLKGCMQSLKGLRILVRSKPDHTYATQWIACCVAVHAYAMHHEAKMAKAEGKDDYEEV